MDVEILNLIILDAQGTIYKLNMDSGNRTKLLDRSVDPGVIGSPYTIAFDWLGRNLYIGNKEASNIELLKVDGKNKYRAIILTSMGGNEVGVAKPKVICLDPLEG